MKTKTFSNKEDSEYFQQLLKEKNCLYFKVFYWELDSADYVTKKTNTIVYDIDKIDIQPLLRGEIIGRHKTQFITNKDERAYGSFDDERIRVFTVVTKPGITKLYQFFSQDFTNLNKNYKISYQDSPIFYLANDIRILPFSKYIDNRYLYLTHKNNAKIPFEKREFIEIDPARL